MTMQHVNDTQRYLQKELTEPTTASGSYYVELPLEALDERGKLLDSLIQLTFDTPHICHLNLRIIAEAQ